MLQSDEAFGLHYWTQFPEDYEKDRRYPALLFLHGAGTRGDFNSLREGKIFTDCPGRAGKSFLIFAPHTPGKNDTWSLYMERLCAFAASLREREDVDPSRLALIGNSMGGFGTWELGMLRPELFSCLVPICGGGMSWNAARLKDTPVWAFHGSADKTVPCDESRKMVDAVNRRGGNARLTVYEGVPHDSWSPTFNRADLFEWILQQRNTASLLPDENPLGDARRFG